MKKGLLLSVLLLIGAMPILASASEEIYFSGAQNKAPKTIPQLSSSSKNKSVYDYEEEAKDTPREIKRNPNSTKQAPMTYGNFPQNLDSSNVMMMMQNFGRLPGQY